MITSRTAGSRAATRVRIAAPQGSFLNRQRGIVVEERPGGWLLVRITTGPSAGRTFPFQTSEIREIK